MIYVETRVITRFVHIAITLLTKIVIRINPIQNVKLFAKVAVNANGAITKKIMDNSVNVNNLNKT